MAVCELCKQETQEAYSCTKRMERQIVFGSESWSDWALGEIPSTCGDCGVGIGGFHHPDCNIEECPKCHRRLLNCDCEPTKDYRARKPRRPTATMRNTNRQQTVRKRGDDR